jgi:hypothetical protein
MPSMKIHGKHWNKSPYSKKITQYIFMWRFSVKTNNAKWCLGIIRAKRKKIRSEDNYVMLRCFIIWATHQTLRINDTKRHLQDSHLPDGGVFRGQFHWLRVALFSVIKYPYKEKITLIREVLKAVQIWGQRPQLKMPVTLHQTTRRQNLHDSNFT